MFKSSWCGADCAESIVNATVLDDGKRVCEDRTYENFKPFCKDQKALVELKCDDGYYARLFIDAVDERGDDVCKMEF